MNAPKLRFKEFREPWKHTKLVDMFPYIRNGFVGIATPFYVKRGIKYLQGKNIKNGLIDTTGLIYVNQEFHSKHPNSALKINDIVMVQSGHVGHCAVIEAEYENANCHALIILSPADSSETSSHFFSHYFGSPFGKKLIYEIKTGNTIEHVLASEIKELRPYFPNFSEQQKIASFLSKVDQKISLITKKHELLVQYKKGVMQKIFNQEIRFKDKAGKDFPEWQSLTFDDVCIVNMGQSPESSSYNEDSIGMPLIQGNADISSRLTVPRIWTSQPTKTCDSGDLILTVRAPVGAVSKSTTRACIGRGVCSMSPKENTSRDFLYQLLFWFESFKWKSIEQGSTFTAISGGDIRSLKVEFPCLEEQVVIAKFLDSLDAKVNLMKSKLELTKEYKQGLLQQMFI